MILGDPARFAIESVLTTAYESLHFRGEGSFRVFINGRPYGRARADSTLFGGIFDDAGSRIERRGKHRASIVDDADPALIAKSFRMSIYAEGQEQELFFGLSDRDFSTAICQNGVTWSCVCESAFDDGGYILQFDIKDCVRLIAFYSTDTVDGLGYDPSTLTELRLGAEEFYGLLAKWRSAFEAEWARFPKSECHRTIFRVEDLQSLTDAGGSD